MQALLLICSRFSTMYVIVDALNECLSEDGVRRQLIDSLRKLQANRNVRLLFTSRSIPEVTEDSKSSIQLEVRVSGEDVWHYIEGKLPQLPKCIPQDGDLFKNVQTKIVEAVDGM